MTSFVEFALLGLGASAAYTLLGAGVVLINRGAGVINFAQAAFALIAAFLFWNLHVSDGWGFVPAFVLCVGGCAGLGVAVFFLVMRPLGSGSPIRRTIATLGLLLLLQGAASLIWGINPENLNSSLPTSAMRVAGVVVGLNEILLFVIAAALTAALWAAGRFTRLGLALRAHSENSRAAATLGWSPDRLGALTWGFGASLGAVAGILIAPISGISVSSMPLLIIPVLAAVLIGSFESFPLLLLAATGIGVGQSLLTEYVSVPGIAQGLPFVVIVLYLVVRRTSVISRSSITERLPELGTGRVDWRILIPAVVGFGVLLLFVSNQNLLSAIVVTLCWGLMVLSVVVVFGYTGQLSLAQVALGGVAALVAGRLDSSLGVPFVFSLLGAIAATVVMGAIFAIPALRTRGINLAIVTLGLANVVYVMVFSNPTFVGLYGSITVSPPTLFGLSINSTSNPTRYAIFVLLMFVACCLMVAGVRRGTAGSRLIAVRANERAAAALGVNVIEAKLFAFCLAAGIAAVGGVLLTFANPNINVSGFVPLQSVEAIAYSVVGGVGFVTGAPGGATLASGGIGSWVLNEVVPGASELWLLMVSGLSLILLMMMQPDGMAKEWARQAQWISRLVKAVKRESDLAPLSPDRSQRVEVRPVILEVENLRVQFGGGVVAVDDATLTVKPGEIVALIGPNGAGKSSFIDAVTGFVPVQSGEVRLNGRDITGMSTFHRTRLGLVRTFQSLELFESLTVRDNMLVGADQGRLSAYFRDLVRPTRPELDDLALAVLEECGLLGVIDKRVDELPYGQRRLVGIVRAAAARPSVILLDEPAAGLSDVETREFERVILRMAHEWGLAVLIVEHDMRFIMDVSDRIVVLEAGHTLATGTPAAIRLNQAVIEAYLGQTSKSQHPLPTNAI